MMENKKELHSLRGRGLSGNMRAELASITLKKIIFAGGGPLAGKPALGPKWVGTKYAVIVYKRRPI